MPEEEDEVYCDYCSNIIEEEDELLHCEECGSNFCFECYSEIGGHECPYCG